jgi:4-amino-4-deoxy-L-arabinose transferase-like glycosyltransferase
MTTFSRYRDYALITILAMIPVILLRPFQNTPFIDHWTYARPVENFLSTGKLQILDWSASANLSQVLWGALFCLPFGFSFTGLRISTWVLGIFGLFGFYNLARIMGISRRDALLSTALIEFCPIFFILSFTFMTDVPWLAMTTDVYLLGEVGRTPAGSLACRRPIFRVDRRHDTSDRIACRL